MVFDESSLGDKFVKWESIEDHKGNEKWYLVLQLQKLEKRVFGDFKINFEASTGMQTTVKFYLWLNVSSILYNEELRKITGKRRVKRLENIDAGIPRPEFTKPWEEEDYNEPVHFEEFEEVDEEKLLTEKDKELLAYPEEVKKVLKEKNWMKNKETIEEEREAEKAQLAISMKE